jgi:hypothetical protein
MITETHNDTQLQRIMNANADNDKRPNAYSFKNIYCLNSCYMQDLAHENGIPSTNWE